MPEYVTVYATAPDLETARRLGRALVEEGHAACANLFPIESVYRWEGAIEEGPEVAMFLKTRADAAEGAIARLAALHPYQVPCAVALPHSAGHAPYYAWVDASVKQRSPR